MRSMLIRLYPALWRARYGDEFAAILEERPLGPFDVADILLGALDAQLRLRGRASETLQGRRFSMSLRIGGIAAIIGGAVWPVGAVVAFGTLVNVDPVGRPILLAIGSLALVVALAGLSAFQARAHPVLTWAAFAVPAVGTIVMVVGVVGITLVSESFWSFMLLGLLGSFGGSLLFAIATYRTAVLSKRAAMVLGASSGLLLVAAFVNFPPLIVVAFICFGLGWFAMGLTAIRLDRPAIDLRPA